MILTFDRPIASADTNGGEFIQVAPGFPVASETVADDSNVVYVIFPGATLTGTPADEFTATGLLQALADTGQVIVTPDTWTYIEPPAEFAMLSTPEGRASIADKLSGLKLIEAP